MKIQNIPVQRINPAPYNPRKDLKPGDPEYRRIERSIEEFGLIEPLVWNKRTGNLVGGHQRFKVVRARGATEVLVSVVDLPIAREKALNIALNRVSGEWDRHKLAELLDELSGVPDLDLALTGFDPPDAHALISGLLAEGQASHGQDGFDVQAELDANRPEVTRPGELLVLGRDPRLQHRLLCGDSTDPAQVRRLMGSERAVLAATDPPYLVDYGGLEWDKAGAHPELYGKFLRAMVDGAIRPNAPLYIWHASRRQAMLEAELNKVGAFVHVQIVWVKPRPVLTRSWYLWQHEPCLMGWIKGKKPVSRSSGAMALGGGGAPKLSTVWMVPGLAGEAQRPDHPTPKPVELFAIPIRQHTRPGEVCYEPFAGSGTQIIAAHGLGRRCFAMELSPRYCDLIVRRFIAFAGVRAVSPAIAKRYRLSHQEDAA